MLLGIDVGGTYTDAVLLQNYKIYTQVKVPTTHNNVLEGILSALDKVLPEGGVEELPEAIERAVISSTIVTNALTEDKLAPVFLAVMTGPGMNVSGKFPVEPYYLSGSMDHRGKLTSKIDWLKHTDIGKFKGHGPMAVSGKFAIRDPQLEHLAAHELMKLGYSKAFLGSELSGELNFIRRTNSAYFAAQTYELFRSFAKSVEAAMERRRIKAPIHVLKADGGTIPLANALEVPVETLFTGPAASVLGIEALAAPEANSISLDVGGTTTDIAFWEKGMPLMSRRGAMLKGYATSVRAFHMRSVGIGGDSKIVRTEAGYQVGPERIGKAMALGGEHPTLSDALITAGFVKFGDEAKAREAMLTFGEDPQLEAKKIVFAAVSVIVKAIAEMLEEYAKQPVYTVDDVIKGREFLPEQLIGVGGGSLGLIKALGLAMELPVDIPEGATVANAIGAAVARPTLSAALRADTTEGSYIIPESGHRARLPRGFNRAKAEELLANFIREQTAGWELPDQETELISYEHFNTVHGYYDTGDIYNLRMQLKPGILHSVEGKEVQFYD